MAVGAAVACVVLGSFFIIMIGLLAYNRLKHYRSPPHGQEAISEGEKERKPPPILLGVLVVMPDESRGTAAFSSLHALEMLGRKFEDVEARDDGGEGEENAREAGEGDEPERAGVGRAAVEDGEVEGGWNRRVSREGDAGGGCAPTAPASHRNRDDVEESV